MPRLLPHDGRPPPLPATSLLRVATVLAPEATSSTLALSSSPMAAMVSMEFPTVSAPLRASSTLALVSSATAEKSSASLPRLSATSAMERDGILQGGLHGGEPLGPMLATSLSFTFRSQASPGSVRRSRLPRLARMAVTPLMGLAMLRAKNTETTMISRGHHERGHKNYVPQSPHRSEKLLPGGR